MSANSVLWNGQTAAPQSVLGDWSRRLWLFLACVLPSLGTVLKFGKGPGLVLYLLTAAIWTGVLLPWLVRRAATMPWAERNVTRLALGVLLLLTALFLVVYPLSHSGRLGKGTDRADALNISIPRLFEGKNPYTVRTYLGNPVTPLPGALVLGAPFRAIFRDAAYQNILWVGVLFWLLCAAAATRCEAFWLWITVIFLCPALLQDVMTGGDFSVNAIYCAASTLWLQRASAQTPESRDCWRLPLLAVFWGVCLCSRPSYLVIVPFVLAYAARWRGWAALGLVGLALGAYAALVLPIYLPAPQDFSPLHVGGKLTAAGQVTPALLSGGVGLAAVLGLTAWMGRRQGTGFPFAAGAFFLALPVPFIILADSHRAGHRDLTSLLFGVSASVFVLLALPLWAAPQEAPSVGVRKE